MQSTINLRMKRKINHVLVILTSYSHEKVFLPFQINMLELTGQMLVKMKISMKTIKKENKQDKEANKFQTSWQKMSHCLGPLS